MMTETNGRSEFEGEITTEFAFRPGRPANDVRAALALVELACTPASQDKLVKALGELALATKARADGGDDSAARIALIARDLGEFPADVALAAIKRRRQGYTFFPSLAELMTACRLLGSRRMALRVGLRKALEEAV